MVIAVLAIGLVLLTSLVIGVYGVRAARSTSDFLVASRRISPNWNAMAIAGEYLSAASVLGLAGLLLKNGLGTMWYAVGFAAGYVAVVALVAGPMRRSGAFTVPDFAEYRLGAPRLRKLCGCVVLVIMLLYLVPQFKGAGVVLALVSGTPYWVGVLLAGLVVSASIAAGGMRSATYVQAFHYVVKLAFIAIPAVYLVVHAGPGTRAEALNPEWGTHFPETTPVEFTVGTRFSLDEPVTVTASGGERVEFAAGEHTVEAGAEYVFPEGAPIPHPAGLPELGSERWSSPLLDVGGYPLFETWSTLLAITLGCMGLPHVIMRFHTSPTARTARRVAVGVIALLGLFYLFPTVYGLLGRVLTPHLVLLQGTDTVAVVLPAQAVPGSVGTVLTALVAAGAFGAFLSTSSGLLLALAGGLSHDLFQGSVPRLRLAVAVGACVAVLLALPAQLIDINVLVVWAFTVAASTFCPLLVLGIWWRRLTLAGAASGLVVGAVTATGAVGWSILLPPPAGWLAVLLAQPAAWTIPLAFGTMVLVSRLTRPPDWAEHAVLRLHSP
ncbi:MULTISPECIES: cation acetate symporter [Nocardiopsis]|uniref:Na+/solute symporter n=1 Tax=Nocardiopsis dassonvillei (strain ATCC 23218 / DSM 43111 / CIP 107115 / JCM 7437 / KCTC 9190 / NBRC 14626 / NCTC 10488 / NRRL B-5397 / IMRU 509) TaxID=446468 RepID=D7AUX6_NOCDD|nr:MULTISPECIES: cation acetate symporter [Nocardiopsis]ADH69526.1 Na+/solute symporter [Nocardiopsis dassonvillei subsp. dassonvillei DSM 43111]APC37530.1 cation acetate symporter [Nocardiopsis dassonvillei]NKY81816.1 cation acetate symporter [Nocardiopsis dassonvillei]VEI90036.1 Acetate transporter ActP [Nocardiopsis dassonvillei]